MGTYENIGLTYLVKSISLIFAFKHYQIDYFRGVWLLPALELTEPFLNIDEKSLCFARFLDTRECFIPF